MPNYGWQGPGETREIGLARAKKPSLEEPAGPDVPGPNAGKTKLFSCDVPNCGRRFKKAMLVARHFNSAHESLKEDKDSWREHTSEVWVA